MFLDSHAHLTCDPVFEDLDGVLVRAQKEGVDTIINVCTDKTTLKRGLDMAKTCKWVHHTGATTPHDVEKEGDLYFPLFENAAREGKLVAIGETGLDYYYEHSPKKVQQEFLARYFSLALECNLPVVIHCRDAFADLFSTAEKNFSKGKAVLHCFTGNLKEAEKGIDKGWLISFSGIITFKKSDELRRVVKEIPLSRILIETDTPYLAPQSKRGKSNEPSFIRETAQTIANVKGISIEEVAEVTRKNAMECFQLT
jgi:TatD DNase family protein